MKNPTRILCLVMVLIGIGCACMMFLQQYWMRLLLSDLYELHLSPRHHYALRIWWWPLIVSAGACAILILFHANRLSSSVADKLLLVLAILAFSLMSFHHVSTVGALGTMSGPIFGPRSKLGDEDAAGLPNPVFERKIRAEQTAATDALSRAAEP